MYLAEDEGLARFVGEKAGDFLHLQEKALKAFSMHLHIITVTLAENEPFESSRSKFNIIGSLSLDPESSSPNRFGSNLTSSMYISRKMNVETR